MEEIKELLDNYFVLKNKDKDLYYAIKDSAKSFKNFITEKLGFNLMVKNEFIKLEKLPGRAEAWMGIAEFKEKGEYVFFVLVLMFLEDKGKEEQFLLSHLIDYISSNAIDGVVQWTEYKVRRQLVNVIKFCIKLNLFVVNDEDDKDFAQNEDTEALYENTGISKYVVRNFPMDIMKCRDYKDLENHNSNILDVERGFIRRNRVYRRLLLSPVVYSEGAEDEDYAYIKNFRSRIEEDFKNYLNWNLHVHKNGALVVLAENENMKNSFPSTSGISDVVLHMNKRIYETVKLGELKKEVNDLVVITEENFRSVLSEVKKAKGQGWSKEYRECSEDKLYVEIFNFMRDFSMIDKKDKIYIYPLISKIIGDYPHDYISEDNADIEDLAAITEGGTKGGK